MEGRLLGFGGGLGDCVGGWIARIFGRGVSSDASQWSCRRQLIRLSSSSVDLPDGDDRKLDRARAQMVGEQLQGRDVVNEDVLKTMGTVKRHKFVPPQLMWSAYADQPLPLDRYATISQPYIVALMTQLAAPKRHDRALDVGTGSGYQAAILAEMVKEVFSVEISSSLAESSRERLEKLGYSNVRVKQGDGRLGWPEHAPYDIIIVAASPAEVPSDLVDQLAPGGRLVIPVGTSIQHLDVITKDERGAVSVDRTCAVRFVPLVDADPTANP